MPQRSNHGGPDGNEGAAERPVDPSRASESRPTERGGTSGEVELLLQQAASGEAAAWRSLVNLYAPRVFGLVRSQCGNLDIAEEITQSTFCTMAMKIAGYTEVGRFESWLFRIAMNRLRDEMRRRRRHAKPVDDEALRGMADSGAAGGEGAIGVSSSRGGLSEGSIHGDAGPLGGITPAERAALAAAMAELSEADRMTVHLRHIGGLSFKEIAEALDEPLGTVLARQHRALKKLKEILHARGVRGLEGDED